MVTIIKSVFIGRPMQEVFDFVSDPGNSPKWRSTVKSSEWITPGPVGVGSKSRQLPQGKWPAAANVAEVTAWEPPDHMTQKIVEGGAGGSFQHSYELQSHENGTNFTVRIEMELAGFLRLISGIAVRQTGKMVEAELLALKTILEEE